MAQVFPVGHRSGLPYWRKKRVAGKGEDAMKKKTLVSWIVAVGIFLLMLFVVFVVPVLCTKIIFQYGQALPRFLVYLSVMMTVMYCISEYGVHKWLASWYERRFGIRLF